MGCWLILGATCAGAEELARDIVAAIRTAEPEASILGGIGAGQRLVLSSPDGVFRLEHLLEGWKSSSWPSSRSRAILAALEAVERVVLIAPATEADWFDLGAVFGLRRARTVRLALLARSSPVGEWRQLPGPVEHAELITDDVARVVSWISGRLFQDLLQKPAEPEPAPQAEH